MNNEYSLAFIEQRLRALPKEIYDAGTKAANAKADWHKLKVQLDRDQSKIKLIAKAKDNDKTQTDLQAKAIDETYDLSIKVIESEATYRIAFEDRKKLENEFVSFRKIGELRKIPGVQ